jgi:hypothetical protein
MVLDLFEYHISGYGKNSNYKRNFSPLVKSKDRNCGNMRIQEYTNNDISKKIMTSCDLLDTVPESEVIDEDVIQQLLQSNELLKRFKLIYEQLPARATLDDIKEPLLSEMKKSCSETTAIYVEIAKLYDKTYKNELSRMKENSYILHLEHNNTDRIVV